ncbi:hypothetical protein Acife_0404 [Acidithiobacillus ferrivorans SS3]|jgi:hypothetical protein|uniref:DUF4224 domain-containing protein n=1 Tax=Acidithiobacillus ferrivorans SS3 TaxID=743299 RepID=G0JSR9_9PROT|nr:DUF4224 domain-containing protein [Acidithiobacillus ferrivorans]AEM46626.1 hypothetical protein Acife_0404 [Acidithiobacillus ferrivorans SS3]MBU2718375.1 DUF4224 domain-containing protein [Acidithiobacillus ferridurans]
MENLLLTKDEVVDLTGYKMASKQVIWLRENAIYHYVGHDGRPKVPREAVLPGGNKDHGKKNLPMPRLNGLNGAPNA